MQGCPITCLLRGLKTQSSHSPFPSLMTTAILKQKLFRPGSAKATSVVGRRAHAPRGPGSHLNTVMQAHKASFPAAARTRGGGGSG